MNWVGGARSRVKYFNNNRVQRDYFERKRLAAKVQRLQPSRKKNGSLDLYFFNKSLTGELKPGTPSEHVKPVKLTKLEARRDIPCVRELELSMSPIGQPSMLDVTEVSADDQELSLYGPEPVKDQPRMSTQKLPHLIKRENSGDTKFDIKNGTGDESLLSYGMDLSTTSESILPPPMKKLKPEVSAPPKLTNPYSKYKPTTSAPKQYSIDEALNASCFDGLHVPALFKPPAIATESHKSSKTTAHQLAYKESKRRKGGSKATAFHEPDKGKSGKYQVPQQHHHIASHSGGAQKRKSMVTYDQDAMLEFHYEEQGHSSKDERKHKSKHQRVSGHEVAQKHFKIDFAGVESPVAAIPSLSEQASLPVASASNAAHSIWSSGTVHSTHVSSIGMSENPFPRRPIVETTKGKEVSSNADLDESILRPIVGQAKHTEIVSQHPELSESILKPIRGPKIQQQGLETSPNQYDTTLFDESIFGPIQKKKDKEAGALPALKAYQQTMSKMSSNSSAFELMMKTFECERQRERDDDHNKGKDRRREKEQTGGERNNKPVVLKNTEWKNFIDGVNTKSDQVHVDQSQVDEESTVSDTNKSHDEQEIQGFTDSERTQSRSMYSSSVTNPKIPFHNISALEELICLEEENAADLISQDFPLSPADWTEDPILVQTQEGQSRVHRPASGFDSSQDSIQATKGSSWNESNINSSVSSEAMCQPPSSTAEQEEDQPCITIKDTPTEKGHHTSNNEKGIKGKRDQFTPSQDVRTPVQSGGTSENIENTKVHNSNSFNDNQAQSDSQTRCSTTSSASQMISENSEADKSPVTNVKDSETHRASHNQTTKVAIQTHLSPLTESHLPKTFTDRATQTIKHDQDAQAVDKLKEKVERLERELGVAQSTLVWQSLMMRLQQV